MTYYLALAPHYNMTYHLPPTYQYLTCDYHIHGNPVVLSCIIYVVT